MAYKDASGRYFMKMPYPANKVAFNVEPSVYAWIIDIGHLFIFSMFLVL